MSITNTTSVNQYVGNNTTATYSYTFKIFLASDLVVIQTNVSTGVDTTLVLNTDYTVTGVQVNTGGSITLTAGNLATGQNLTISRVQPLTQLTEFRNQSEYFAELHENAFDKLTMITQQQQDDLDRTLRVPESVDLTTVDTTIAPPAPTTLFGWNAAADAVIGYTPDDIVNAGSIGTFTANRALVSNAGGVITASTVTSTEVGYLTGLTQNITSLVAQADTSPGTFNIGVRLASGTFTVCGADGANLSASNPGYVVIGSQANPGRLVRLTLTANQSFNDDSFAGTSDIAGEEFGTKPAVAWSNDRPFFLYAVNRDDTAGNLLFGISPNPTMTASPSSTNLIGYKLTPSVTPSDSSIWLFGSSLTTSNYTSRPVLRIGGIRMRKAVTTDDWTVQTLSTNDGIRPSNYEGINFLWSAGEALFTAAGRYFASSGSPSWATPASINAFYKIQMSGYIHLWFDTTAAGLCTNGSNGSTLEIGLPMLALPLVGFVSVAGFTGGAINRIAGSSAIPTVAYIDTSASNSIAFFTSATASTAIANNSLSNTADDLRVVGFMYPAFGNS
jgi:hypothetical protein